MLVAPVPPVLRNTPLLTKSDPLPPAYESALSLFASHSPELRTAEPENPTWSAFQVTAEALLKDTPMKFLVPPASMTSVSGAVSGLGATPGPKLPVSQT